MFFFLEKLNFEAVQNCEFSVFSPKSDICDVFKAYMSNFCKKTHFQQNLNNLLKIIQKFRDFFAILAWILWFLPGNLFFWEKLNFEAVQNCEFWLFVPQSEVSSTFRWVFSIFLKKIILGQKVADLFKIGHFLSEMLINRPKPADFEIFCENSKLLIFNSIIFRI